MVKITMPECATCHTKDRVFQCKECGKFTCRECVHYLTEDTCLHRQLTVLESIGWL